MSLALEAINPQWAVAGAIALSLAMPRLYRRLQLSRAKHPSLAGHARMARAFSKLVPYYSYQTSQAFHADGAPLSIAAQRQLAFVRLAEALRQESPGTHSAGSELREGMSDVAFVHAHRVPFQFRKLVQSHLPVVSMMAETAGPQVRDLDGVWRYDLTGSYGVNLLGYDTYKAMIQQAVTEAHDLGPILGPYHTAIAENVRRLQQISGQEQVSFHMSGTEAVMQAVRLARYHTKRSHVVRFTGAYHGWWDGVQPGVGNPRPPHEVYTLREMHPATLEVLRTRRDIACVLINPLQALTPNAPAAGDSTLITSGRKGHFDKEAYTAWLKQVRDACTANGIALIFDEVFLGFRLARGGAQEYFGVRADLVTYGKTLGGGFPVGVVCGDERWMKRWRDDAPADICFARGTFNSHPYVMTAMRTFLRYLDSREGKALYHDVDGTWNTRADQLNKELQAAGVPVLVANMTSVFTMFYTQPGRYHWLFQYYLRKHRLLIPWTGTGRFIFSHTLTDADWQEIAGRIVAAAREMQADAWWWNDGHITAKAIRKQIIAETVRAWLRR